MSDEQNITVAYEGGRTRVYSQESHGDAFRALAESFVSKSPRRYIISNETTMTNEENVNVDEEVNEEEASDEEGTEEEGTEEEGTDEEETA